MKRVVLAIVLAVGTLLTAAAPVPAAEGECRDSQAWPSFAEVAPTARSIYLVKVTRSVDGIAEEARSIEVMRGAAPGTVDLRRLQPGRRDGCPATIGPYAQLGDRLLIAYDGTPPDRVGSIDAVAQVGRVRDRRNASGLERLTLEEARAFDAPGTLPPTLTVSPAPMPPARWSPRPSFVPAAGGDEDVLWSCGGGAPGFPRSVLTGPSGMETVEGAVFDGLRSALETMRPEFELEPREDRAHQLPWLLAYEDEDLALFLVRRAGKTERYSAMYVEREGDAWGFGGYSDDCRPRPLITHGMGSSEWRIDADSPPVPGSSTFPVEVMERECASGRPADGRIADPIVDYGEDAITITVPVRRVEGDATCPGNPWTPFVLELDEPVGDRLLLDGGPWPPEQRWPSP